MKSDGRPAGSGYQASDGRDDDLQQVHLDAGGVLWPWSVVRYRNGGKIFEMYSAGVSVNAKPNPKLFVPPMDAKRLKPE